MSSARKKEKQVLNEQEKTGTDVALQEKHGEVLSPGAVLNKHELPAELGSLADQMEADAGQGTSQAAEDNIVPIIRILQSQSPEAMTEKPEYIEGTEPGDIYARSLSLVIRGKDGIIVQPCHFSKAWVEWVPRAQGGGFVTRHEDRPDDAYEYEDQNNPGKMLWKRKTTKNDLVETRYHAVLVDGAPFIIPFSSSGHTTSRGWMALMNSFKTRSGKTTPSYARQYRMTTTLRSNKAGDWYDWKIEDMGWVPTTQQYLAGKALHDQMALGEKTIEADKEGTHDDGGDAPF